MSHFNPSSGASGVPRQMIYLPGCTALVNPALITLIHFSGPPDSPSCRLSFGCDQPSLEIQGHDLARLMEFLQVDLQAVQSDLQQARSASAQQNRAPLQP